jgi:hypothetical protein
LNNSLEYANGRNPTHIDKILQATSHHPLIPMRPVITTLMDNVRTICDESNQAAEHAKCILRKNGYSIQSINRATKATCTNKSNKIDHTAYLHFTHGSTDRISGLLTKEGIHKVQKTFKKMASHFRSVKETQQRLKKF